jgi:precorrin-6B methylase 2
MDIFEIGSYIEAIEKNPSLYEAKNFEERIDVEDFIGFQLSDQLEELLRKTAQPDKEQLYRLRYRAERVKAELEQIDITLFQRLRAKIRTAGYTGKAFRDLVNAYVGFHSGDDESQADTGYDNLDTFLNGLFLFQPFPEQTKDPEPEMVYYQKTPARIVFELVEQAHFEKGDVFFDVGAGLGQVAILVNLLAGIKARGIEFEPAFCDFARHCAAECHLSDVTFINVDAREADYSGGTVFFMYTPFRGEMLEAVLALLKKESLQRKIKIITYGPCTAQVALQTWLEPATPVNSNIYRLMVFSSM